MSASDEHNRQLPPDAELADDRGEPQNLEATRSFAGGTDRLLADQLIVGLPQVIGRFQVKGSLGRGSFGEVYEGWDDSLQRSVAVKLLTTDKIPEERIREWLHEARTLAALDHPGIVPVYDLGQDSAGRPFIVSKLITGGSLASRLSRISFSHQQAARLVAAVARALDYAHRCKVVHRDVKPANILLGDNGEPVLADFGLAIHESELGTGVRFVGTPSYMSPEQARREGHRVDGRSDIYSLGVVFYELLTGKRPFEAEDVKELLECVRNIEVRPPRQIERSIPKELEWICLKALAKRASERYSVASDFADELSAWLASVNASTGEVVTAPEVRSSGDSVRSKDALDVSIIPRGLRPFNSADADFFLQLLPGPRDRNGLPESVRFWKTQIEKQDPDDPFRVGVVIGPSGSGKSSLVRAGIAPHLDPSIAVLLVEARPEEFEKTLHKRLRHLLPEFERTVSLTEALIQFRRNRTSASGQRLLLVIDQFEQWLSQHGQEESNFITEALRQCDGVAIQALLLVRDDFTLALADFMNRLEEPLLQNHNFATVDFFSPDHAKRVLAAFGRAYGTVDETPTREQQRFLDLAIHELETNGKVVPVQLALFADMVKERQWVPNLLRDFGGARGVGVAFLDDRLNGPNAHPEFRSHRILVRRLLASLLPAEGVEVRPPARSRSELMTPLLTLAQEASIERVLGLLDSELRLVTPSVSSELGSAHSDSSTQDPAIQLTHDYLVPSIRQWLDVEERSTQRGRATIRLRELAHAWNAKPEVRRLPAWTEWLTIHGRTRHRDWNAAQSRMMRTADARVAISLLLLAAMIGSLWFAGQSVTRRWRVDSLADQVVNADIAEIGGLVSRIGPSRSAVATRLQETARELDASDDKSVQMDRRRLNIALVLACDDSAQAERLLNLLPTVAADDLIGVRGAWPAHASDLQMKLWSRFEKAAESQPEALLSFGAILAHTAPDDQRWPSFLPSISAQMAAARTVHIQDWISHFQPLAKPLGTELVRQLQTTSVLSEVARSNLLEAIISYCPGHSDVLASAVASAHTEEFASLLATIDAADSRLRAELRREFIDVERDVSHQLPDVVMTPEVADLNTTARAHGGFADAESAMAYDLSESEFAVFTERMARVGYSPSSIRPYGNTKELQVASVWRRENLQYRVEWNLTCDAVEEIDKSATTEGLWMEDFAMYQRRDSESAEPQLVCLWVGNHAAIETRCYFDRPDKEHDSFDEKWSGEGFTLHRYAERMGTTGDRLHSAIWRKAGDENAESTSFHRFRRYFGDHEPGLRQTDLRLTDFALPMPDRNNLYLDWRYYEDRLGNSKDQRQIDINRVGAASRLSAMGRLEEAKASLVELLPRWENNSAVTENLAVLYARLGLAEEFRVHFDAYRELDNAKPHAVRYLTLLSAVLAANVAEVNDALSQLAASQSSSDDDFKVYLRGLAVVASRPALGDASMSAINTLRQTLPTILTGQSNDDSSELFQEIEFDAIRDYPEIRELFFRAGLSQLTTGTYREDGATETRFLLSSSTSDHATTTAALRRDGYLPVTLEAHSPPTGRSLSLSSVWERKVALVRDRITEARTRAQLAMALARLGEDDLYLEGMIGKWGSDVQSHLILESPSIVPAAALIEILRDAKREDLLRGLTLAAGGYDPAAIPASDLSYLQSRVQNLAMSERHAGVRQAACWCLTKWGQPLPAAGSNGSAVSVDTSQKHLDWFANSLDQTLIVLQPPERFLAGSPHWDPDRKPDKDESQMWIRIGRTFAISATETTIEQFSQYLNDPRVQPLYKEKPFTYPVRVARGASSPQISVSWLDAVRFCQWLSEKEGLAESDWCYPGVLDPDGKTVTLPLNFRDRRGYRLPTEAEWEFAARGDRRESRHCGYDPELLSGFEWYKENSGNFAHQVATLRPNPFGLFDMLGNAGEFSDGVPQIKHTLSFSDVRVDHFGLPALPPPSLVYSHGGRYTFFANSARSAERDLVASSYRSATSGFRVARTLEAK